MVTNKASADVAAGRQGGWPHAYVQIFEFCSGEGPQMCGGRIWDRDLHSVLKRLTAWVGFLQG
jgi:hypothetical protein